MTPRWPRLLLAAAAGLVVLAAVRSLTGAHDLTSSGAVRAALQAAVPIGLAGLGGLWAERAGVINIGLEGQLILGTWFGAWAGHHAGPAAAVAAGIAGGALSGLLHALATVTFGVDHIVSGVALTLLAAGVARYLSQLAFLGLPGGGVTQSPPVPEPPRLSLPGLDALHNLENRHWFLVSDIAGLARGTLTDASILTILAIATVPASYAILWRTPFGLRLRAVGENPHAAETLGVDAHRHRYYALTISGALAGLGGVYLSTVAASIYREGQTGGRGFIGLAAMIFGNWRPGGLATGSLLFGYTDALQLRGGSTALHALLPAVALLLAAIALRHLIGPARAPRAPRLPGLAHAQHLPRLPGPRLLRRDSVAAAVILAFAVLVAVTFAVTKTIPREFLQCAPHLTTLVVLAFAAQRLRPPAATGQTYRRGGR